MQPRRRPPAPGRYQPGDKLLSSSKACDYADPRTHETPVLRDAVYDSFALTPDSLKLIGSPKTLDQVIRNALAVRLGDEALAADVYADLHRQVVRTPER